MPVGGVAIHRQALSNRNGTPSRSMPPHPILFYIPYA